MEANKRTDRLKNEKVTTPNASDLDKTNRCTDTLLSLGIGRDKVSNLIYGCYICGEIPKYFSTHTVLTFSF